MNPSPIRYAIRPLNVHAHTFEVRCAVAAPDPAGQCFALPAWIPGSYLIRDFARHVIAIRAESGDRAIGLTKLDKHTWRAAAPRHGGPITVICEIYAWDVSVRGAYLDETQAFFNGTSVFLRVIGQEDSACLVDIQPPAGNAFKDWRVATTLEPARGERRCAALHGFGLYRAADYDELIDHPVAMGRLTLARFDACGVLHEIALAGQNDCDLERLASDLKRICEWQIRFFGEPAPMPRYAFLVTAVGDAYGGLEHRASTALLCSRNDLPWRGMKGVSEGYRRFLGLCSHEYFHAWNVKRIMPAAFMPYDLGRENYTTLLWAFEGITSYYDDLALLRSGVIELEDWLQLLAKTIGRVRTDPGRLRQTLAESSFDAWSKFYRPDENTPNAVVSYYTKGALAALALDLTLRAKTHGAVSLDDVMRALWQRHGKTGMGIDEETIRHIAEECSGLDLKRFFAQAIHGTGDLPLKKILAGFGVKLDWEGNELPSLGVKTVSEGNELKLATVYDQGAGQKGGLAAGDVFVAIDGLRVTPGNLEKQLARHQPGDTIKVHVFRRDRLIELGVRLGPPMVSRAKLTLAARSPRLRRGWLGF